MSAPCSAYQHYPCRGTWVPPTSSRKLMKDQLPYQSWTHDPGSIAEAPSTSSVQGTKFNSQLRSSNTVPIQGLEHCLHLLEGCWEVQLPVHSWRHSQSRTFETPVASFAKKDQLSIRFSDMILHRNQSISCIFNLTVCGRSSGKGNGAPFLSYLGIEDWNPTQHFQL